MKAISAKVLLNLNDPFWTLPKSSVTDIFELYGFMLSFECEMFYWWFINHQGIFHIIMLSALLSSSDLIHL